MEEDDDVPEMDIDRSLDFDTDIDEDLITPDNSMTMSSSSIRTINSLEGKDKGDAATEAEDVEAAIALLGFKIRN